MEKIIVATNNQEKLKEIQEIFNEYKLLTLKDVNCDINVVEDGNTFEENAKKKAMEVERIIGINTISDDSGLCIDTLNDWPGVYTARFLGEKATSRQRNEAILEKMKDIENRNAKVVCVISYCEKGNVITTRGELCGKIAKECRGDNGFRI